MLEIISGLAFAIVAFVLTEKDKIKQLLKK